MNLKQNITFFIFLLLSFLVQAQNEFITIWQPNNSPTRVYTQDDIALPLSTSNQIYFPGIGSNYQIDWEEIGNTTHKGTLTNITSEYSQPVLIDFGTSSSTNPQYKVKVSNAFGTFSRITFGTIDYITGQNEFYGDNFKIIEIQNWGSIKWTDMHSSFYACKLMDLTATDIPDLSLIKSTKSMFSGCENFKSNATLNSWDTTHVIDMSHMFANARNFNQNIGDWNTSNVEDMNNMFIYAEIFNENINNWNTSKVKNMSYMFAYASQFNQNIGNWNTSNVTNMSGMFVFAKKFNQNIENWNTSNVTNMGIMFGNAESFDQNIGNWNLQMLTDGFFIFLNSNISCYNFNKILLGWANNSTTPNNIDISNLYPFKYSSTEAAVARNKLINKGWTISGDTYDPSCLLATNEISASSKVEIYPNPASDFLYIKNSKENEVASLYDISGKLIRRYKLNFEKKINIKDLRRGNYVITINGISTKLILK